MSTTFPSDQGPFAPRPGYATTAQAGAGSSAQPGRAGQPGQPGHQFPVAPGLRQWLVQRRNDGATPDEICAQLVDSGMDADSAAQLSLRSLRASDRHRLLYIGQCWGAGLGALGAGTAAHLALAGAEDRLDIAMWLTVMLVATPIAVACGAWARRVEDEEAHAIWSPTRRTLFAALAACTGVVGIVRALSYVFLVMAAMVEVEGYELTPASLVQVMVTLGLAGPLFWWSLVEWRRSNVAMRSLTRRSGRRSDRSGRHDDTDGGDR